MVKVVYCEVVVLYSFSISNRISGSFKIYSDRFIIKVVHWRSIKKLN